MAIGSWAVVSWFVEPLWHRAQQLEQRVLAQRLLLEEFSQLLVRRSAIDQAYEALSPYLSEEGTDEATLLEELEALARHADAQIDLKPQPPTPRRGIGRGGVELNLAASQERVFALLDTLLRMPRLIDVSRVQLANAPGKPGMLSARLLIEDLAAFQLFRPLPMISLASSGASAAATVSPEPDGPSLAVPSLATYASKPLFAAPVPVPSEPPRPPSGPVTQLTARLTLLGIIAGEPAQAIIEDRQIQKTFFVTEGQAVVEGAVVQAISKNRVVLERLGETIELIL